VVVGFVYGEPTLPESKQLLIFNARKYYSAEILAGVHGEDVGKDKATGLYERIERIAKNMIHTNTLGIVRELLEGLPGARETASDARSGYTPFSRLCP